MDAGRVVVLERQLRLPTPGAATTCLVRATAHADGTHLVVLVVDSTANHGTSLHLVFDLVVQETRPLLPTGPHEPIWVHRWDERALASVILRDVPISRDHVMVPSADGWHEWPLPRHLTRSLLA